MILKYIVISYANIWLKDGILYRIVLNVNKILTFKISVNHSISVKIPENRAVLFILIK